MDKNPEDTSDKKQPSDTLVYSIPVNYIKSLDTLNVENIFPLRDYRDMMTLFEERNYIPESWQAGIRETTALLRLNRPRNRFRLTC